MANLPKDLLQFRLQKYLGQNFLRHPEIAKKIAAAGDIRHDEMIVEVGPGLGILTKCLAEKSREVIAIEKDIRLKEPLERELVNFPNVKIFWQDALNFDPPKKPYKLIANIPYSITSPLLNHFIRDQFLKKNGNTPLRVVLMVQKEVAKKICASPPDMNVLALNVQTFGKATYLFPVSKNVFSPKPKVDSAVIKIEIYEKPLIPESQLRKYFEIISAAFSQKRKTLGHSLKKVLGNEVELILKKSGVDPKRRPEALTMKEWEIILGSAAIFSLFLASLTDQITEN